jgi:predicted  nucleic acid-binding Zn ribbon protein
MTQQDVFDKVEEAIICDDLTIAEKALEQYARIRSIEFKEWLDKRNRFLLDEIGKTIPFQDYKTNEELFDQFTNQTK